MKQLMVCCFALLLGVYSGRAQEVSRFSDRSDGKRTDPYSSLAEALAYHVQNPPMNVGVGNFLFGTNARMSAYSAVLREELEMALARTGKFKVITRFRLADLQNEARFQQVAAAMNQGTESGSLNISGVDGIVRGNFFYEYPNVTVYAELARLDGGEIHKAKTVVHVGNISARIWPDGLTSAIAPAEVIEPRKATASNSSSPGVIDNLFSTLVAAGFGLFTVLMLILRKVIQ